MVNFKHFYSLLLLLPLVGCSGNKTTAQLEVSASYITTNTAYSGGFMVLGQSSTGKKISVAVHGSNQTKIPLEAGTWTFTAIGWEGSDALSGSTQHCGQLANFNLSKDNSTATIEIKNENCALPEIEAVAKLRPTFKVYGCNAFYTYDASTDQYTPINTSTAYDFCNTTNMISDYVPKFKYYKIVALQGAGQDLKPAFSSQCNALNYSYISLGIPTANFPFNIKLFNSQEDCNADKYAQTYVFPNGIEAGSPLFDSMLVPGALTPSPIESRVVLATTPTKRGRSPFMKEIPRILCGAAGGFYDCFEEPWVPAHVNVPWRIEDHWNDLILMKNLSPAVTSCPANLLANSKMFNLEGCEVEKRDGVLKAVVTRNHFMCNENMFQGDHEVKSLKRRKDKVYAHMVRDTSSHFIKVLNQNGKMINQFYFSEEIRDFAISDDALKLLILDNTNNLIFYELSDHDGNPEYAPVNSASFFIGDSIEINGNGSYFYVIDGSDLKVYPWGSATTPIDTYTSSFTMTMKYKDNYLYIMESEISNSYVYKIPAPTTSIPALGTSYWSIPGSVFYLEVADSVLLAADSMGSYFYKDLVTSVESSVLNTSFQISSISIANGNVLMARNEPLISTIEAIELGTTASMTQKESCNEYFDITVGGVTKPITLISKMSGFTFNGIFDQLLEIIGRRKITNQDQVFYWFQALNEDNENNTGGELRRVQELLGPQAIGGFFTEYPTCNDLYNALPAAGPVTRQVIYREEWNGRSETVNVKIQRTSEAIAPFNCSATEGSCSSEKYDIQLEFQLGSISSRFEKVKFKIACGKQIGSLESYEKSGMETSRELYLYQTEHDASSRFEKYELNVEGDWRKGFIAKFWKPTSSIGIFRAVRSEAYPVLDFSEFEKSVNVTQLQIDETHILTNRFNLYQFASDFYTFTDSSVPSFQDKRDAEVFTTANGMNANSQCMLKTNTALDGTNLPCTFDEFTPTPMSKNSIPLAPVSLDMENSNNILATGVFEITP